MNYQRKYENRKANILNLFVSSVKECDILNKEGFILESYDFQNGRNEDDFIEFIFEKNSDLYLNIHFWINFWIEYRYNDDFLVTYFFERRVPYLKNEILLKNSINFKTLAGFNLNKKIEELCKVIKEQIDEK